ncbi:MAG: Zn-ribbon domain-containing OB-fold protein [Alphaproteobacteria bacterium]|nr:Zn-ribbon domain-containing OB-fold protein [Alphaproteobacteria bacterium]
MSDPVFVPLDMAQTWRYAASAPMARFCEGLKAKRIEALRCDQCGRRYLPPRPLCGNCHRPLAAWVPVANQGRLEAWTVVHIPMLDGRTGKTRPAPYGMGLIRLDGADTTLNHYLAESDPQRLAIGQRVRAVWREGELLGAIDDILHFEVMP